jgi:hypothetical protein
LVEPMEPWEAMGSPGYSMTDPWCCHIVGDMDPINIPLYVSIYTSTMDPMGICVFHLFE